MTTVPVRQAFDYLATEHRVPVTITHTGGGNYVAGIGQCYGYDEEQGTDRYAVNVGPLYREDDGTFAGESGDLYAVSIHPNRSDVIVHVTAQLLPTIVSMLGIDDVNVDDATLSLDDIAAGLGEEWSVACLGGNIYGVVRMESGDGYTAITLDDGAISFLPASVIIGRQLATDDEWREVWSGTVWTVAELADILADRA